MAVDAALVAAVRGLIWDPPRAAAGERLGVGDGRRVAFELAQAPVLPGTLRVWVASDEVTGTSTVDLALGLVTLVSPPAEGEVVEADYQYALLSDAAITSQLEAHGENVLLTAARCLEVLLLDPASVTALRVDSATLSNGGDRRQAIEGAIGRYRRAGAYARFQARIDGTGWGGD